MRENISARFTDPCAFAYLRCRSRVLSARVRVRAVNARGSLIVSRTSARRIDLSHARRQIAAHGARPTLPRGLSQRREKILFLAWEEDEKGGGNSVREQIGRARAHTHTAALDSTYLVFFRSGWLCSERPRRKWNQWRLAAENAPPIKGFAATRTLAKRERSVCENHLGASNLSHRCYLCNV